MKCPRIPAATAARLLCGFAITLAAGAQPTPQPQAPTAAQSPPARDTLDRTILPIAEPEHMTGMSGNTFLNMTHKSRIINAQIVIPDVGIDLATPVVEAIGSERKSRFTGRIPAVTVEVK